MSGSSILRATTRVAIVGMSSKPARASYFVVTYLIADSDYELSFVNPTETEILGRPVYPSLAALPEPPELVDVFRRHDELPKVADEAVAAGARVLWLQLGLQHEDAAERAPRRAWTS